MLAIFFVPALLWAGAPSEARASDSDFRLESDRPERGVYRLWASETLDARADALLEVLSWARCRAGCEGVAEHVAVDEVLETRPTEDGSWTLRWSLVDSVLDGSDYSVVEVVRRDGRIVRRFFTAPPEVREAWESPERPHDPFFHRQGGSWTLTEAFDAEGRFLHTRVEVEMEMRSDRFLVNLAPGRVISGASEHLRAMFSDLRRAETHRVGPVD